MSLVLNFPSCLRYILLTEWMTLPDVGRLDCSLVNRLLRTEFECMLRDEPLRHIGFTSFRSCVNYEFFLRWLTLRGISVQQLKFYTYRDITFFLQQIPGNSSLYKNLIYISVENLKPYATSNPALNNVEDIAPAVTIDEVLRNQQLFHSEGKLSQDKALTEFIMIIRTCPKLQTINFSSSIFLEEEFFQAIRRHTKAALTSVTEASPDALASPNHIVNIRSLNLNNGNRINFSCIENIIYSFPLLHTLSLRNCRPLQDNALLLIATSLPSLRYLNLAFCAKITDIGVTSLAEHLPQLETLILYFCKLLKNPSLEALRKGKCRNSLRILDISGCSNIDNIGLMHLASDDLSFTAATTTTTSSSADTTQSTESLALSNLSKPHFPSATMNYHHNKSLPPLQLAELSCFNCFRIANSSLLYFTPLQLYHFKKLSFANCRLLTNMAIAYLVQHCCNVTEFSIKDCIQISDEGFLISPYTKEDFAPYLLSHSTGTGNQAIRIFTFPTTNNLNNIIDPVVDEERGQSDLADTIGDNMLNEGNDEILLNDSSISLTPPSSSSLLNTEHTHTFVTTLTPLVDDRIDFATSHQYEPSSSSSSSSSSSMSNTVVSSMQQQLVGSTKHTQHTAAGVYAFSGSSSRNTCVEDSRSMLDSIHTLHLEYTNVTDITLYNFALHAPSLRNVYLTGCKAISSGAIRELTRQNHHVHVYIEHE